MADSIYVINVDGYIGESTRSEIEYALRNGKIVYYLEPVEWSERTDSKKAETTPKDRLRRGI